MLKYDFHVIYAGKNQTTGLAFSSHYNFYQKLASNKTRTYTSWSNRCTGLFLGGLSLHLNHLIASGMTIYDWPFGTLPFRLFGSNLDTRDLETYPRTYSGHF